MSTQISKQQITKVLDDPFNYANTISILNLVKLLEKLNKIYRQTNKGVVSDEVYDIMIDVLKKRDPKNKFLNKVGETISKDKVELSSCDNLSGSSN